MTHSLRTAEPDESYSNSSPLKQDKIFKDLYKKISLQTHPDVTDGDEGTTSTNTSGSSWYVGATVSF